MSASADESSGSESDNGGSLPGKTAGRSARTRDGRFPVGAAKPADYTAIYHFLTAIFHGPTREEFRAVLDDPYHEPQDRVLIRNGSRIVGHVHTTRRVMQFGPLQLPVGGISGLGVMPELCGRGYGRQLLALAERRMAADGALLGLLRTRVPHFFRRSGWALCCRHCRTGATARDVLSGLETLGLQRRRGKRLNIRLWRRMELGALVRIYGQNLAGSYGPFERTEAYWQWLVNRKAYDQIYVALDGPALLELEECRAPIVGYAITRGEAILELFTAPGRLKAAAELLARACGDAIERDCSTVALHAPPGSRLDKLFRRTGAKRATCGTCGYEVLMVKLLNPVKLLRVLSGQLHYRAEAAGLSRPINLGLLVDGKKYQLAITRDGVTATGHHTGRSYLGLNVADFTRLVLGRLDWSRAVADGRVKASTQLSLKSARVLFPRLPLWRPPLDELSA